MITRLQAAQDIRLGRGIKIEFIGQILSDGLPHIFNIILRRDSDMDNPTNKYVIAIIDDMRTFRKNIRLRLTWKQALRFIRSNYERTWLTPLFEELPSSSEINWEQTPPTQPEVIA